jgi:hypothetical protein
LKGQEYKRNLEAEEAQRKMAQEQMMFERGIASGQLDVQRGNLAANRAKLGAELRSNTLDRMAKSREALAKRRGEAKKEKREFVERSEDAIMKRAGDLMEFGSMTPAEAWNQATAEQRSKTHGQYDVGREGLYGPQEATTTFQPRGAMLEPGLQQQKFAHQRSVDSEQTRQADERIRIAEGNLAVAQKNAETSARNLESMAELRKATIENNAAITAKTMQDISKTGKYGPEAMSAINSFFVLQRGLLQKPYYEMNAEQKRAIITRQWNELNQYLVGLGYPALDSAPEDNSWLRPLMQSVYTAIDPATGDSGPVVEGTTSGYYVPTPPEIFVPGSSTPPSAPTKSTGPKKSDAPSSKPIVIEGVRPGSGGKSNGKKQSKTTSRSIKRVD